jgi:hypothetical protein
MSLTACEEPSVSDAHRFATLTNAEEVKGGMEAGILRSANTSGDESPRRRSQVEEIREGVATSGNSPWKYYKIRRPITDARTNSPAGFIARSIGRQRSCEEGTDLPQDAMDRTLALDRDPESSP